MARFAVRMLFVSSVLLVAATGFAQSDPEDADLSRLPTVSQQSAATDVPAATRNPNRRVKLEDALTAWDNQDLPVPPPGAQPAWENRSSLDADLKYVASSSITLALSDRFSTFAGNTIASVTSANFENDLREAYIADEVLPRGYVELGRINLKEGIAYGYSPTDFFKPRTAVEISSLDPSVAREDRLGVVMIEGQKLFDGGSISAAFAPRLRTQSPIPTSAPASFDPQWGRTNSDNRGLITASWTASPFNPQVLAFFDGNGTHLGASASHVFNASTVGYFEWSGVREPDLTGRALAFGQSTGAFPAGWVGVENAASAKHFSNDLTVGTSWSSSFNLTLDLEYHYHQSGLTDTQFERTYNQGLSGPRAAALFWYLDQYASDRQEPLTTRQFFLRADWQDVIPSTLNLGGVAFVAQRDGSALAQIYAQYLISRAWTVSAYLGTTIGSTDTVFGNIPWRRSAILQLVRYL